MALMIGMMRCQVRERKAPTREQLKHARLQRATTMVLSGEYSSDLPSMAGNCGI